ncbi:MAG: hypothetical protein ABR562_03160 [Thermoplasmatota archaeon]
MARAWGLALLILAGGHPFRTRDALAFERLQRPCFTQRARGQGRAIGTSAHARWRPAVSVVRTVIFRRTPILQTVQARDAPQPLSGICSHGWGSL